MSEMELRDAILRHALQLQRLSAGQEAEAAQILDQLEKELKALLQSQALSDATKAEINDLINQAAAIIQPAYDKIASSLDTHQLAVIVADRTVQAMEDVLPDIAAPTPARLASLTKDVLIDGAPASAWWAKQAEDTAFKFAAAVRQGVVNGETNESIVSRIASPRTGTGILDIARRNARALVHSSIMSASNAARLATFRSNSGLLDGVRWLSTLDSLTCFSADTPILMADGTQKPIAEVREGELVIGGVSGKPQRVFATMKSVASSSVVIHCDGQYVGRATEDHPILNAAGYWRPAGSLAVSADLSQREVVCRHFQASEHPLAGTSQASGERLASCGKHGMAQARCADDEDHREGDELRDGVCDGAGADRATENKSSERLQHDGRRRRVRGRRSFGSLAEEDHGQQSPTCELARGIGSEACCNVSELERPELSGQGECGARSTASGIAQRSRMEGKACRQVRGNDAQEVERPKLSGEDEGTASVDHPCRGSQASCCEASFHNEHRTTLNDGPEILGEPETCAIGVLSGHIEHGPIEVYNLSVEGDPTFIAGGIVVHNCIVCAALDGSAWTLDGDPIGATKMQFQAPPKHWSCRCVLSPIPKAIEGLDEGTRASAEGPISATTTFAQFLKRNRPFAEQILGAKRAALFEGGKLTLTDFVTGGGTVLTLDEL